MLSQDERDALIRIDERTRHLVDVVELHIAETKRDFAEVHKRINPIAVRQGWIIGIGSGCGVIVATLIAWIKATIIP